MTTIEVYTIARYGFRTFEEAEAFRNKYGYETQVQKKVFTPHYCLGRSALDSEKIYAEKHFSSRLILNWEIPSAKTFSNPILKFLRMVLGADGGNLYFPLSLLEKEEEIRQVREILIGEGDNKPFTPPTIEVWETLPSKRHLYVYTVGYAEGYRFDGFLSLKKAMQHVKDLYT